MTKTDTISQTRARVSLWLRNLGQNANLVLSLNEEGVCGLGHASGIDCAIEVPEEGGLVYLRAPLAPWPPSRAIEACEQFLTASFFGMGTEGASFAIDPRDRELILWKGVPVAVLDEEAFDDLLSRFLNTAAWWRDQIVAGAQPPLGPGAEVGQGQGASQFMAGRA